MNEIACNITNSTKVLIKAKSSAVDLNEPLYAVNWFSTKMEWAYHFYNILASRSVTKIGGKAFFKGKVIKTILDENSTARELILIIQYPGGNKFKALMESTYFKVVSVFRMLSVKKFSFGFTQKQLVSDSALTNNLAHAVHHFKAANITPSFFSQFEALLTENVQIKYAGKMVADLVTHTKGKEADPVPNIMDGIVIFESEKESNILDIITSPKYQSLIKTLDGSYIGTLNRIL